MRIKLRKLLVTLAMALLLTLTTLVSLLKADTGTCGGTNISVPFTDVAGNGFFCQIAAAYLSGLTNGTTPTTYSPGNPVTREQMAAFITRTLDQSLQRGSQRAALDQWWRVSRVGQTSLTTVGDSPEGVKSDGADLWVANSASGTVSRVRASDGKILETWTGAANARAVLVARGGVYVTGNTAFGGKLYAINPKQAPGQVTTLTSSLGDNPSALAYDGLDIWVACTGPNGGLYKYNISTATAIPAQSTFQLPFGLVYDGDYLWVADQGDNRLYRVNALGEKFGPSIQLSATPNYPAFDGTNIWVPCSNGEVAIVRAKGGLAGQMIAQKDVTGAVLRQAAFDGEYIMVTKENGDGVLLFKASNFDLVQSIDIGNQPWGVCSDGINFWVTLKGADKLARL